MNPARVARLGREVFGVTETGSTAADALTAIDALQNFFCTMGMPRYLDEFGFTPADIDRFLTTLYQNKGDRFGSFKTLDADDARAIYLAAFKPADV